MKCKSAFFAMMMVASLLGTSLSAKAVKIGFLLSTMQEERYEKDRRYFEAKAKELGAEVVFDSANNKESDQVRKMENMLRKGVNVIVVQPVNSDAASTLVSLAKESNVSVIAYDRIINNAAIDYYVTQDSKTVGRLQAEAAVKMTGGKGNFIILKGQSGHSVANAITEGVMEVLKPYIDRKEITVVSANNHDGWSSKLAADSVENALTKNKGNIQAILANNSGMATGAVSALESYDKALLGKVFVAGADADLAAIKNIVSGKQSFEVLKDIRLLAETSVELAVKVANGEKINFPNTTTTNNGKQSVQVVNTPVFPVVKETIDEIIVGREFHTKNAIYGK